MARKKIIVTVPAEYGRDSGKHFRIEEFDAVRAEKWAWRLFLAVKGTEGAVPTDIAPLGMIAVAIHGINAFLASDVDWSKLEPLLDEMLECVTIARDVKTADHDGVLIGHKVLVGDIEEPATATWLRSEVVRLHTNFSFIDAASTWITSTMALMKQWETLNSQNTSTSPPQ
jgi:hypothetical protein